MFVVCMLAGELLGGVVVGGCFGKVVVVVVYASGGSGRGEER